MHAFLIISQSSSETDKKISGLLKDFSSKPYPFELSKIEHVRALEKFTKLKLPEKTAVIIKDFQNATEPAQNAFLKNLEEPQENLIYILSAPSENFILPTILSRCQIIYLNSQTKISKEDMKFAQNFLAASVVEKLLQTSEYKNRDNAKQFLNKLILSGHKLIKNDPKIALKLEVVEETFERIKKNGNPTLQLLNMCLKLD
jgi:hypothetical protein